jgi:hypothetical protein
MSNDGTNEVVNLPQLSFSQAKDEPKLRLPSQRK